MVNIVVRLDFGLEFLAKASLLQGQGQKIWP